jgi:sulfur carrier protein
LQRSALGRELIEALTGVQPGSRARKIQAMTTTTSVRLLVNGETQAYAAGTTVADLVHAHAVAGKRIAVERNGAIVPRSQHASTVLEDGDHVEIVIAVGGG